MKSTMSPIWGALRVAVSIVPYSILGGFLLCEYTAFAYTSQFEGTMYTQNVQYSVHKYVI